MEVNKRQKYIAIFTVVLMTTVIFTSVVMAKSIYLTAFTTQYPNTIDTKLDSCDTCHTPGLFPAGKKPVNYYGRDYQAYGYDFVAIEGIDSDSDGFTNIEEINALTFPGDPNDFPAPVNQPPAADFTWMADYLTVYFTDASTDLDGTVVAWFWDFGDGVGTSTEQNPTYTYANAGSYEVTLTVTDDNGATDSVTKTVTVEAPPVNQPPIADFSWSPTTPDEGQSVQFTDASTDPDGQSDIVGWSWDFGDGATSTMQNPTHTYTSEGSYTVTLTVTDTASNSDTTSYTITVNDVDLIAGFTYSPAKPTVGETVQFTDTSTSYDGITSWSWDFGDGATSTMQNPSHTYTSEGSYTVTLTVTESDGDTSTATDTVTVSPPVAYDGAILKVQAPKRVRVNTMGGTVSKTVTVVAEAYNTAGTTDIILQKMYGGVIKDTYYAYNVVLNPGDGASRIKFSVDISYTDISPDATGVITWHAFLSNGGSDTTNDEGVSTTQVVSYTK